MAGVARHKDKIARGNRLPAPREVVRHTCRLAVFVGPEEADVEVVAGKLEVVGIAAKECDLLLGREDEPHVGIFLGSVKMVEATLMERDHVAPQAGGGERLLLDLRHHLAAGSKRLGRRHARRDGPLHAGGDILDRDEHVEFEVVALEFVGLRGRHETIAIIVMLLRPELLQAVGPDMMVREHEAIGRDKRSRATRVEPHRRLLQVRQPLRRYFLPFERGRVILLQSLKRRMAEEPHPFVGSRHGQQHRASWHEACDQRKKNRSGRVGEPGLRRLHDRLHGECRPSAAGCRPIAPKAYRKSMRVSLHRP